MAAPRRLPDTGDVSSEDSSVRPGRWAFTESGRSYGQRLRHRQIVTLFSCLLAGFGRSASVSAYDTARADPQMRVSAIAQYIRLLAS